MILKNILDIDHDDPRIIYLQDTGNQIGLTDFFEVVMTARNLFGENGKKAVFLISEETAGEVIGILLSAAIMNFACWKHEEFQVEMPGEEGSKTFVSFFRRFTPEEHKQSAEKYLENAEILIKRFYSTQ